MTEAQIIHASHGWRRINLRELWEYRDLLFFFAWRDIKVRYKQTLLGIAWAAIQPLAAMLVFTFSIGKLAHVSSGKVPYALFCYTGLMAWTYFSKSLGGASNSLVGSALLITKIYFPRILIPAGVVLAGLADFVVALVLFFPLLWWFGFSPSAAGLSFLLPSVLSLMSLTLGLSLILSTLQAKYRDVGYAISFFIQLWMFVSPVLYPLSLVPDEYLFLIRLNPLTGILEGFRYALLGSPCDFPALLIGIVLSLLALLGGAICFTRFEKSVADFL